MRFAVVEDNLREAAALVEQIEKYCMTRHIDRELTVFHMEKDLCSAFEPGG